MVEPTLTAHFAELIGIRICAPGDVRLRIEPAHLNEGGRLLGPISFAMVNYAMAGVVWQAATEDEAVATVNVAINFVASAERGEARCTAQLQRRTRSLAAVAARICHEDGQLLVDALGTFAIGRRRPSS